jgi:hypothetical protein
MPTSKHIRIQEVVTGIKYDGTNQQEILNFCNQCTAAFNEETQTSELFFMGTIVNPNSWVIKDPIGGFSTMANREFNILYDPQPAA